VTLPPFQRVLDEHRDDVAPFPDRDRRPNEADDAFRRRSSPRCARIPAAAGLQRARLAADDRSPQAIDAHRARGAGAVPVAEMDRGGAEDRAARRRRGARDVGARPRAAESSALAVVLR